jgi:hypothetical protein
MITAETVAGLFALVLAVLLISFMVRLLGLLERCAMALERMNAEAEKRRAAEPPAIPRI